MAKKKLSQDQKRRLKKRRKERSRRRVASDSRDKMLERLKNRTGKQKQVIQTPVGDAKMSEVMWEFLDPYLKDAPTPETLRMLITIGQAAWNVSLLPDTAPLEEKLQEPMQAIPPALRANFIVIVKELIERKEKYFAQYRRPILDYELVNTREGYHLSIVSAVAPNEIEE